MATQEVYCKECKAKTYKNGYSRTGKQRYRCTKCGKSFQVKYEYNAWKEGVKEQIERMSINGSGIRDTVRVLGVSINTVLSTLKKFPEMQR